MAGNIKIDTQRCKGCGLCVTVCSQNTLVLSQLPNRMGYFPAEQTSETCTGCALCALV